MVLIHATIRCVYETGFDLTPCTEFTVEAGRPDTISREKLVALRQGGVTRISINPQTLNLSLIHI